MGLGALVWAAGAVAQAPTNEAANADETNAAHADATSAPSSDATNANATAPSSRPRPLAITISGAASLGAYEAGYVHYVVESLRGADTIEARSFVGTSAGSVNALLGVLSSCLPPAHDPRRSLFWQTWMPIGVEGLHDPDNASAIALFHRGRFDEAAAPLERIFAHGLPEGCDRLLGAAVTAGPRNRPGGSGRLNS